MDTQTFEPQNSTDKVEEVKADQDVKPKAEAKPVEQPKATPQPTEQPKAEAKLVDPVKPVQPTAQPEPPHKNLFGYVNGVVKYKDEHGDWVNARWQPPYPTPSDLSDYVVKPGDQIWRIANNHHVPNTWIRHCNAIPYSRQNSLRPGTVLKMTYTPSRRDFFID